MRGPKPQSIDLTQQMRQELEQLTRRAKTPQQIALRAHIVLLAADGLNNAQIARQLAISIDATRLWRKRWLDLAVLPPQEISVQERLEDLPRPGAPRRISAEQVCRIVALACEAPRDSNRPISQWTGREIADEIVKRGILPSISERHAARLLKRGISSPTKSAIGSLPSAMSSSICASPTSALCIKKRRRLRPRGSALSPRMK